MSNTKIVTPELIVVSASLHKLNFEFDEKGNYFIKTKLAKKEDEKPFSDFLNKTVSDLECQAGSNIKLKGYREVSYFYQYDIASDDSADFILNSNQKNYAYLEGTNPIHFFDNEGNFIKEPPIIKSDSRVVLNLNIWCTKVGSTLYVCSQPVAVQILEYGDGAGTAKDFSYFFSTAQVDSNSIQDIPNQTMNNLSKVTPLNTDNNNAYYREKNG